jgi:hypothetical protein
MSSPEKAVTEDYFILKMEVIRSVEISGTPRPITRRHNTLVLFSPLSILFIPQHKYIPVRYASYR